MLLLTQFLLRLAFGLAFGMLLVSPRQVTSGYYRNNLYVTLGLTALAALLCRVTAIDAFWYAVLAASASYVGSVCWLYERPTLGRAALLVISLASLAGAMHSPANSVDATFQRSLAGKYDAVSAVTLSAAGSDVAAEVQRSFRPYLYMVVRTMRQIGVISAGLLLGTTMAAMLLGHWYLNSPTMELRPLRRLILAMGVAVALQLLVSSLGLWGEIANVRHLSTQWTLFVLLRWLFGLVGVAAMAWMAWQTLKIPNTQSATGVLYVAVIGTFVGETMSLLLSAESLFPV